MAEYKIIQLLTSKLQEGFSTHDDANAVLRPALVSPVIDGLACVVYDQVPVNHTVSEICFYVHVCSIDQPAVNTTTQLRKVRMLMYYSSSILLSALL